MYNYISFRDSEAHGEITKPAMLALQYADFELEWPPMMVMEQHLTGLSLHVVQCLKVSMILEKVRKFWVLIIYPKLF